MEQADRILELLRQGDKCGLELLFRSFYRPLVMYALKFVVHQEEAEDIVQEVFLRFWESKSKFENHYALKSFLYHCVQHAALNYLEKLHVREKANRRLGAKLPEEEDVFCFQVETDVFEEIFAAVEELPGECKRIFKMSYIEMLDIKTICEQLDVAESTVKTQRQRAKKYLRDRLQHLYPVVMLMFF